MSQFESPELLRDSTREGALLVAEQLALEQSRGDRRAVHFYESRVTAFAQVVDRAGDHFLARARFALNEHSRVGRGDGFHLLQDSHQGFTLPNNLLKIVLGADFVFEIELFLREFGLQLGNLAKGQRVVDRDGDLVGDLSQEVRIVFGESVFVEAADVQSAERPVAADERDDAGRLQPFGEVAARELGRPGLLLVGRLQHDGPA